ncbi:MAG: hypothetical protein Q4B54_11705 [Coriobacteriales bacterium]|nr:hypothetical protein [Coriobacteriales bacterium]
MTTLAIILMLVWILFGFGVVGGAMYLFIKGAQAVGRALKSGTQRLLNQSDKIPDVAKDAAEAFRDTAKDAAESFRDTAKETAEAFRDARRPRRPNATGGWEYNAGDGWEPVEDNRQDRQSQAQRTRSTRHANSSASSYRPPRPEPQPEPEPERTAPIDYEYFNVDAGATPERIARKMHSYENDEVVGTYARAVIQALDTAEFRRQTVLPAIDAEFKEGTISWDRFVSTTTSALSAVLRNCALLANRVQTFDTLDYQRIERYYRSGGMQDENRLKRWKLLQETKDEMDRLRSANEGLLLELGKLTSELGKLSSDDTLSDNEEIFDEVSHLVDETKYYR